jgi:hypothetical protein
MCPDEHGQGHNETSWLEVADGNSTSLAQILLWIF